MTGDGYGWLDYGIGYGASTATLNNSTCYQSTGSVTASTYDAQSDDYNIRYATERRDILKLKEIEYILTNSVTDNSSAWKKYEFYDKIGVTDTTTISRNYYRWTDYNGVVSPPLAPSERIRQMIRDRVSPAIHRRRTSMSIAMDIREERARQTLRRIIGEQAYKRFIRDGFITVVPKSGLTYRIYPGHGITQVYDRGIMVDRLCVVLQGNFPPTDSLLMRYLLILNDEGEFSKYAVKHSVTQSCSTKLVFPAEAKPLTEAWAKLKVA